MRMPAAIIALLISAGCALAATPEEAAAICAEAAKRYEEQFGAAQSAAGEPVVAMYKHTFCPRKLTVKRGTTVKFVNVDKRTTHSFWFRDAGKPESERFLPGEGASMTIDLPPGEHTYLCGPHWEREDMTGTLTVMP